MTDGIAMSHIEVGDVEFTTFDFAGQPEYAHTHMLFFNDTSISLLKISLCFIDSSIDSNLELRYSMFFNNLVFLFLGLHMFCISIS